MKKIFLLLFVLPIISYSQHTDFLQGINNFPKYSYSEHVGYHRCGDTSKDYSVGLDFNKSQYVLTIFNYEVIDLPLLFHISYGSYTQEGDFMYLTDSLYGYKTVLQQDQDSLFGLEGLPLFKGKKFDKQGVYNSELNFFTNKVYPKYQRLSFLDKNTSLHPLQCGVYTGEKFSERGSYFSLELNQNDTYVYKCGPIIISSGKWKRAGALLVLTDDNLDVGFFMLIAANNILIDNTMPNYEKTLEMTLVK